MLRSFAARILPAGSTREKPSKPASSSSRSSAFDNASTAGDDLSAAAVTPVAASALTSEAAFATGDLATRICASLVCESTQILSASLSASRSVSSSLVRLSRNELRMTRYPKRPATPMTTAIPSGMAQYRGGGPRYEGAFPPDSGYERLPSFSLCVLVAHVHRAVFRRWLTDGRGITRRARSRDADAEEERRERVTVATMAAIGRRGGPCVSSECAASSVIGPGYVLRTRQRAPVMIAPPRRGW